MTADHETGGLSVTSTPIGPEINVSRSTWEHTGNMVPLYANGIFGSPFAANMDNTDVGIRLLDVLSVSRNVAGDRNQDSLERMPVFSRFVAATYSIREGALEGPI